MRPLVWIAGAATLVFGLCWLIVRSEAEPPVTRIDPVTIELTSSDQR